MSDLPVDTLIPKGASLLHIAGEYGPLKDEVRCSLSWCRTSHGKGYFVCFSVDGVEQTGRIGHICGAKNFGVQFKSAKRKWENSVRAEELKANIERFRVRAARVRPEVEATFDHLHWQGKILEALSQHAPEVVREAGNAVRSNRGRIQLNGENIARVSGGDFWTGYDALRRARSIIRDINLYQRAMISTPGSCPTRRGCDSGKADQGVPPWRFRFEVISTRPG